MCRDTKSSNKFSINTSKDLRGIDDRLVDLFNQSVLKELITTDNDLLACIRCNAIGIYHRANKVATIHRNRKKELVCDVNEYYISGFHTKKEVQYKPTDIINNLNTIKENSNKYSTPEKQTQQILVSRNNSNPGSEWFCVDIEYRQSPKVQNNNNIFNGRFDIIAISKTAPHKVAIIELKYNSSSIDGKSGIVKHIQDFHTFINNPKCYDNLKQEIASQLKNLKQIGVTVPQTLSEISIDSLASTIEFYIITLWDDTEKYNPKEKMGRFLFSDFRKGWVENNQGHVSTRNAMAITDIDVENNPPFHIRFLFKHIHSIENLNINSILQETLYDCSLPRCPL